MKVCFFNCSKVWGGGENWHLTHAIRLKKMEYDVTVASNPKGLLLKRAKDNNIKTHAFSISNLSFLNPFKLWKIYRFMKKERFDVVILNFSKDIKTAAPMARLAGTTNIVYRRGSDINIKNSFINRFIFANCLTHVIANSEATKRSILHNNPNLFPADKICVIYNGIDFNGYENDHTENAKCVVGTIGRLAPQKRHDLLVNVAANLKEENCECKVRIGGEGPLKEDIANAIKKHGVGEMVEMTGFVEHPHEYLQSIDIFALTSEWEGFGYVVAEAMRAQLPVVAFATSSVTEIVEDGVTGFLVPFGDTKAFAQAVARLVANCDLRRKMGDEGYKRASRMFNFDIQVGKLLDYISKPCKQL